MPEKRIYGRSVQKHDVQKNWEKATNFTPMAGEIVVYDRDENYDYERFKIGDGITLVNDLPFAGGADVSTIIDITEFPTEDINESAIYRVQSVSAKVYVAGAADAPMTLAELILAEYGVNCVVNTQVIETLPGTLMTSTIVEGGSIYLYVVESTGVAYGDLGGGTATLGYGIFNVEGYDRGWSTDINSETEIGCYCVRDETEYIYYAYKNGVWTELSGGNTTDKYGSADIYVVMSYSTVERMLLADFLFEYYGTTFKINTQIVKTLPNILVPCSMENAILYLYVVGSTGIVYGDLGDGAITLGYGLFESQNPGIEYDFDKGWSTDINSETEMGIYCVRTDSGNGTIELDTTLTQFGMAADAKAVGDAIANKVDKVDGKGLSTNDFTTTEKNKLDGVEEGANKYIHPEQHSIAEVDGLQSALDTKVDKEDGKGLSTNDFTDEYKDCVESLIVRPSVGLAYTLKSNGEYEVSGIGTCTDADIVIPDVVDGCLVTSIGVSAFNGCTSVTSITIPESVTTIGHSAFYNCSSLTSITIPDSVTSIGGNVFVRCSSLTNIIIPDCATSLNLGGCSSLTSITIPDSVTSLTDYAFSNCSSLTSITIPDSVTSIGQEVFFNSHNVTIYCEAESQPEGWNANWNPNNRPVVWGFAPDIPSLNTKIDTLETELKAYIDETFLGGAW